MLNLKLLELVFLCSSFSSAVSMSVIQKTKGYISKSKYIPLYSFFVNLVIAIFFCNSFTSIDFPNWIWVGLLSFLGSDTMYKSLEGKLLSYDTIRNDKK